MIEGEKLEEETDEYTDSERERRIRGIHRRKNRHKYDRGPKEHSSLHHLPSVEHGIDTTSGQAPLRRDHPRGR